MGMPLEGQVRAQSYNSMERNAAIRMNTIALNFSFLYILGPLIGLTRMVVILS